MLLSHLILVGGIPLHDRMGVHVFHHPTSVQRMDSYVPLPGMMTEKGSISERGPYSA